jgi:hypothetical protein
MKTAPRFVQRSLAVLLTLTATAAFAQQGSMQQAWLKFSKELGMQSTWSADMEMQTMGMNMTSKIYHDGEKSRTEMTMPMMNMKMVALSLVENGKTVSYTLFPDKKKYCINPSAEGDSEKFDYTLTDAGTEEYEGAVCKKRRLTIKIPDQGTQTMDILFSPAQKNMPVKMTATVEMKTQGNTASAMPPSVILFKNHRFDKPSAELFTVPKDYTQAKNAQEVMMGGLFGGGQGGGEPRQPTLPPEALQALKAAQAEMEKARKAQQ